MEDISFATGIVSQGNDLKSSAVPDATEASILSAHRRYFHGYSGNHDHDESALYDCVIKYFGGPTQ